jgi:pimeloyl-ACP methyl ester carboxylesterase
MPALAGQVGKAFAAWRYGIDWKSLDLRRGVAAIRTPLLVLHGDADAVVPYATSRAIARRFPDRVTLVSFHRADHAEGWNVDSLEFNGAVREFMGRVITARR